MVALRVSRAPLSLRSLSCSGFCVTCVFAPMQPTTGKKSPKGFETQTPASAFTRKREIIAGRAAMSGFISALIGEFLTGKGALGQLQLGACLQKSELVSVVGLFLKLGAYLHQRSRPEPSWTGPVCRLACA